MANDYSVALKYISTILPNINKLIELHAHMESIDPRVLTMFDKDSATLRVLDKATTDIERISSLHNEVNETISEMNDLCISESDMLVFRQIVGSITDIKSLSMVSNDISTLACSAEEVSTIGKKIKELMAVHGFLPDILEAKDSLEELKHHTISAEVLCANLSDAREKEEKSIKNLEISRNILLECKTILADVKKEKKEMINIANTVKTFTISTSFIDSDSYVKPFSEYNIEKNNLHLVIKNGKTGEKGDFKGSAGSPGEDGKSFSPMFCGSKVERGRYSSYKAGVSYLALDEIPVKLYFKRSQLENDWTDGVPFGVVDGGFMDKGKEISVVGGVDLDKLTEYIISKINNKQRK